MKTVAYASAMCAVASTVALAALVALLASSPGAAAELISTPAAQPAEDVGDGWCVGDLTTKVTRTHTHTHTQYVC